MHGVPPVIHQVSSVVPAASASTAIGGVVGFVVVLGVVLLLMRARAR